MKATKKHIHVHVATKLTFSYSLARGNLVDHLRTMHLRNTDLFLIHSKITLYVKEIESLSFITRLLVNGSFELNISTSAGFSNFFKSIVIFQLYCGGSQYFVLFQTIRGCVTVCRLVFSETKKADVRRNGLWKRVWSSWLLKSNVSS